MTNIWSANEDNQINYFFSWETVITNLSSNRAVSINISIKF